MIMSIALAYRFKQIHYHLKFGIHKKYDSIIFWQKIRDDYSQVATLCQKVNKKIGNMIVISFGANMYFIVTQLYKGLVTRRTIVDQCYFMYSFGLLLSRTIFVIYYGSMVELESKKPLSYLVSLRNEAFNLESQRFILQVYTQNTSLSGGEYFVVTRGLLFQMAAVIITYELFMVQAGIHIYL
ncbi:gustatory receptor for sugar taste 64a-like [Diabrotica virgifera virgifera]|uniref:Uncharacterized protein n=1 Tax=Diabrotica virgifera virgifera TaxID=50390 RepID=A0ABM5L200_DIAVI|nr:gustatory receptor for sugar taste 64a-like [Diabrotica virgifera virgifera]